MGNTECVFILICECNANQESEPENKLDSHYAIAVAVYLKTTSTYNCITSKQKQEIGITAYTSPTILVSSESGTNIYCKDLQVKQNKLLRHSTYTFMECVKHV